MSWAIEKEKKVNSSSSHVVLIQIGLWAVIKKFQMIDEMFGEGVLLSGRAHAWHVGNHRFYFLVK